ncbi:MAG: hypothetical protein GWN58_32840 [Anaerolineae bacterium]|nr:hypothetical protein [Thermoplasmata archaeon]NIV34063.1 hypothetical protein [Anaerolineae bacterium]NIY05914.1 hypothetical protein [Thermoplasmata archaeon]
MTDFAPDFSRPYKGVPYEVRHERERRLEEKQYRASITGRKIVPQEPCCCCGKAVRLDRPHNTVMVIRGGAEFEVEGMTEADWGDWIGALPVGSDCLRKVRKALPNVKVNREGE